jgi:CoA:oxalate CoA-transferase
VIVENFGFGVAERRKIDYGHARQANPAIVYCSIKGFGSSGDMAHRVAYDAVIQAEAAIMEATRTASNLPVKAGISISDLLAATVATAKIVTALFDRRRNGNGAFLDVSLYHTSGWASLLRATAAQRPTPGATSGPSKAKSLSLPHRQCVKTGDGTAAIALETSHQAEALLSLAEAAAANPLDGQGSAPETNSELEALIREWASAQPSADLFEACAKAGVPAGEVLPVDRAVVQPHAKARGILIKARGNGREMVVNALSFTGQPQPRTPQLIGRPGTDNGYVYGDLLGLSKEQVRSLHENGVI